MNNIQDLISRSQEILRMLAEFGNNLFEFLTRSFTLGTSTFSVLELLFGTGLFVFLAIKIALAVIQ